MYWLFQMISPFKLLSKAKLGESATYDLPALRRSVLQCSEGLVNLFLTKPWQRSMKNGQLKELFPPCLQE